MRIFRVSDFLPDITQQIHSLRASGVISFHVVCAAGVEARAFRKSPGILCAASFLVIRSFYHFFLSPKYSVSFIISSLIVFE